ncbi:MAG: sugar transferase [Spirochaetes bacterium]|nr:sugar transferase [Spirochaetota bacterium]MBU0954188.1 sugar transferase [Spirochaetota bacterium]
MVSRLAAGLLLAVLFPLLLAIALILLIEQGRPILFVQDRAGFKRKLFQVYKFRTMAGNRATPVGKILRSCGLDELPQLFNIMNGSMAFIGPRPLTESDIERLGWSGKAHDLRWQVKPGLTGLSQLSPVCSAENTWKLDETFVQSQNAALSLTIAVRTVLLLIRRKGDRR